MKNYCLTLFLSMLTLLGMAQKKWNIQIGTGMGSYKQDDLKIFQQRLEADWNIYGLDVKTSDDFPMYFHYTGEISLEVVSKLKVGLIYRFESTGYKSSYADYSGYIRQEQLLRVHEPGLLLQFRIMQRGKFAFHLEELTYYSFTSVQLKSAMYIQGTSTGNNDKINSNSLMLNPGMDASYQLVENVQLHLGGGYCIDLKGNLKYNGNEIPDLKSDWSGIRINAGLSYSF